MVGKGTLGAHESRLLGRHGPAANRTQATGGLAESRRKRRAEGIVSGGSLDGGLRSPSKVITVGVATMLTIFRLAAQSETSTALRLPLGGLPGRLSHML